VDGQLQAPAALPSEKTRYPLYRRLGEPQSRSGHVRKIPPPLGIRSPDRPAHRQSLYRLLTEITEIVWSNCQHGDHVHHHVAPQTGHEICTGSCVVRVPAPTAAAADPSVNGHTVKPALLAHIEASSLCVPMRTQGSHFNTRHNQSVSCSLEIIFR
jgi:hypothetical protein